MVGVMKNAKDEARDARKVKGGGQGGDVVWRGYVNVTLTAEQKEDFDVWWSRGDFWQGLEDAVRSGCTVSLKEDKAGGGVLCSVTQRRSGHVNAGLCVTARGGTAATALGRGVYQVCLVGLDADWESVGSLVDPDRW